MLLTSCNNQKSVSEEQFVLPATEDIVMYQINPRVFAPSNSLKAVTERIDSIRALGVNVMWIMPIYPIGEVKSKNSPYSIKDYKAVAKEFGTIDDLKTLIDKCHESGMGVILDWVANHTSWDNAWIKQHKDWYTQENGEIISPKGWDWSDVADLNYDNKEMRKAMIDAMKFWIVETGLDGFRCDVADGVPADFWKEAIDSLRKAAGERKIVMLAEGKREDNFTVGGFDLNYGWDYKDSLVSVFVKGASAENLFKADKEEYKILPEGKVKMRFTTNHDHSTIATPVKEFANERGSMAAYVATIFPHGGALVYGSQEVGYDKPINFFKYVAIDWTANPNLYKEYQHLIGIYNEYPALRKGKLVAHPDKDIMMFEKTDDDARFLIAVNVRNAEKSINTPAEWAEHDAEDMISGKKSKIGKTVKLKPFQYIIMKF